MLVAARRKWDGGVNSGIGRLRVDKKQRKAWSTHVEEYGDQEVKRKLLGADVKLTQGTTKVLLKLPAKERKAAVNELVEKGELARAKKGTVANRKPKEVAQSLVSRLKAKGEGHARSVLQQMARMLGMEVVEKDEGK